MAVNKELPGDFVLTERSCIKSSSFDVARFSYRLTENNFKNS